jgi:DNA polymerase I-like protein with 3'-5' exonuclease and polymerase domains
MCGATFNPGSSKQVGEYLTSINIAVPKTNSGKPATGVEVLQSIGNEFTDTLIQYRSATKTLSTYIKPYEAIIASGDGRVHPDYTILRTLTGRSSARNLNIQNLDRDLKGFFDAPPGHTFVSVDFSAIEFRIAAWFAREQSILEQYATDPNWDPHRFVAAMFYNKPVHEVTKSERQIAKSANFGLLYMSGVDGLCNYAQKSKVDMDLTTAKEMYDFWHETFPGFRSYYKRTKDELIQTSQVVCPTGHIRHFGNFGMLPAHMKSEALRQAVNCKVQNFSAHIAYIAMAELEQQTMPCIGFIHDAFLFDYSPDRSFDRDKGIIEDILVNHPRRFLAEKFNVDLDIPLAVEFEVRKNVK